MARSGLDCRRRQLQPTRRAEELNAVVVEENAAETEGASAQDVAMRFEDY